MLIPLFGMFLSTGVAFLQQDLPPGTFHFSVTPQQRMAAIDKIDSQLKKLAAKSSDARRAEYLLSHEACLCEPLGDSPSGESLFRFIRTEKVKKRHWFGVIPVFSSDAKGSRIIRELLEAKPPAYAGIDPDAPIIYLRVDGPNPEKALKMYVLGINSRAHQSD